MKVCAAPSNISLDKTIHISGGWNGTVLVKDRGGDIKEKRLNIYCKSHQEALLFGRRRNCNISY